jgi:hypothetical protein
MQVEVGAELEAAVRVRQGHAALDIVRDSFRRGIGEVVNRQDNDMVAYSNATIRSPVTPKSLFTEI